MSEEIINKEIKRRGRKKGVQFIGGYKKKEVVEPKVQEVKVEGI
jgi:hypothetical protein